MIDRVLPPKTLAAALMWLATIGQADAQTRVYGSAQVGQTPATAASDDAAVGKVGEFIGAGLSSGTPVVLVSGSPTTVGSISLTAGDWDVNGTVGFTSGLATNLIAIGAAISTVAAALPSEVGLGGYAFTFLPAVANSAPNLPTGTMRLSLTATTTVYLVCYAVFSGGTGANAFGFIRARRMR